jgi:hypothetical protein
MSLNHALVAHKELESISTKSLTSEDMSKLDVLRIRN